MKAKLLKGTAALALVANVASAEEVRVFNWSDYIDESLLEKFEAETGIKLIYDVFDSNEVLETKLLAGGSGYDVVVPSGTFLQRQIMAGACCTRAIKDCRFCARMTLGLIFQWIPPRWW